MWTRLIAVDVCYLNSEQFRNCTESLFVYSRFCALLKLSNWQIYLNRFIVVDVLVFSCAINPAILHFYCIMQKFQASWWCFVLRINTYLGSLRSKNFFSSSKSVNDPSRRQNLSHLLYKSLSIEFLPKITTAFIFIERHLEQTLLFLFIWSFFCWQIYLRIVWNELFT